MKYIIFFLAVLVLIFKLFSFAGLDLDTERLTRFGYGYLTGQVIIIVCATFLAFFSGRAIMTGGKINSYE